MNFITCTMTGQYPRRVNFKSDEDLKKTSDSLSIFKKCLKKDLENLFDRDDRIKAAFEALSNAMPDYAEYIKVVQKMLDEEIADQDLDEAEEEKYYGQYVNPATLGKFELIKDKGKHYVLYKYVDRKGVWWEDCKPVSVWGKNLWKDSYGEDLYKDFEEPCC